MQAMSEAETGSKHQRGSDVPNASLRPPPMNKRRQTPTLSNSQYHHFNYADPLTLFTAASHRLSQSCSIPREMSNARGYRQPCLANPHATRRIKQLCTFPFHIKSRCRGLYGTVRVSFVTQQQFFIISTCYTTALAATGQSRDYGFYPLVFLHMQVSQDRHLKVFHSQLVDRGGPATRRCLQGCRPLIASSSRVLQDGGVPSD